jgi:hypothetical protein
MTLYKLGVEIQICQRFVGMVQLCGALASLGETRGPNFTNGALVQLSGLVGALGSLDET